MTYTVAVYPGTITCGKCGYHMAQREPPARGARSVVIYCGHYDCEQRNVSLVFPLEVRELERAE